MNKNEPTIRVTMLPKDTNYHGTIFGGVILSYLDLAAGMAANHFRTGKWVTVAMKEVEFISPVFLGDLVSFYTEVIAQGTTSVTVKVRVLADRVKDGFQTTASVTEAITVYVMVDENFRPIPFDKKK
jgi:acyl-CoA thioesterase YciA